MADLKKKLVKPCVQKQLARSKVNCLISTANHIQAQSNFKGPRKKPSVRISEQIFWCAKPGLEKNRRELLFDAGRWLVLGKTTERGMVKSSLGAAHRAHEFAGRELLSASAYIGKREASGSLFQRRAHIRERKSLARN